MKVIEVDIGPGGEQTETRTEGFQGGACRKATEDIRKLLGDVSADTPTAEANFCGVGETANQA